jgi:photosystem II stability/assembly factor-like uncharacterized protein
MKMLSRVAVAAFLLCAQAAPGGAARGESGQVISRDSGRMAATDGAANAVNSGVFASPADADVVVNAAHEDDVRTASADADGGAGWIAAGPWGGGATAVAANASNPRELLAGARNSLVYRSADAGANWTRLAFPRHFLGTVTSLVFDTAQPGRYLVGIDANGSPFSGLWTSDDEGRTWKAAPELAGAPLHAIAAWPKDPRVLAAGTAQGVWVSEDSGRTWRRISKPWLHEMRVITAVEFASNDRRTIYAGTPHLPWKTSDGGETWQSIHEGLIDDTDVFSIYSDPRRPERVLLSACSGIYHTETGGAAWTKFKGIPPTLRRTHVVQIDRAHPEVIYAGTTLGLLKSTDGTTFKLLNDLAILGMAFDPRNSSQFYIAAEASGLWKSGDGGKTLERVEQGFTSRRVGQMVRAGMRLYLTTLQDGDEGGLFASDDRGANWKLVADAGVLGGQHFQFLAAHPANPNVLIVGNADRLRRSMDAGKTWKDLSAPGGLSGAAAARGSKKAAGTTAETRLQALAAVEGPKAALLYAGTNRGLFRSADFGSSWSAVALTTVKVVPNVQAITVAAQRVLVRTGETLYLSNDAGAAWKPLSMLLSTATIYDVALSPRGGEAVLLGTAQGLYRNQAGSTKWERVSEGLQDGTVTSVAWDGFKEGYAWCVQFGQLYESADNGRSWHPLAGSTLENASIRKLWADRAIGRRLLAVTPDLGIYYLDLPR